MNILYVWKNCNAFNESPTLYYFIECPKDELSDKILNVMKEKDRDYCLSINYLMKNNEWVQRNTGLGRLNCIYFLISENLENIILEEPMFPYSSQWNTFSPLKKCKYEINDIEEIKSIKQV
jgi:hypothetical protein